MGGYDDNLGDELKAEAASKWRSAGKWLKRHWWVAAFAAIVLLGFLAGHGVG